MGEHRPPVLAARRRRRQDRGSHRAFIDADKENMDGYYEGALRLVRPGGLVILDNMFQGGRIIDPDNNDFRTNVVRDLNSQIAADERVDRVLVPIGDGMTLARRRG
jgi:predicted O-methyltransferase YrrM